jgi:hypothetical protein
VNITSIDISPPAATEPAVERYTDTVFSFDSIAFLAAMCAAKALFMWRFVPESKNLFLEKIEEYWKSPLRAARA